MHLSDLSQSPVTTAAILDATLPVTELTKHPVKIGGPDFGGLLLLGLGLAAVYALFNSSTPDPRGTIRGF